MTTQEKVVSGLVAEGFMVVESNRDIVRLTKGSDARLVRQDGTIKRAQHILVRAAK
jgi:hypothetical protein